METKNKETGELPAAGENNSKPIKQVEALGVDIEPSEIYDWCYVFKDGIYVGKIKWIEIDKTLLKRYCLYRHK